MVRPEPIDSYILQERLAIMDLKNLNGRQAEMLASIDLDHKPDIYTGQQWQTILINTNKILFRLQEFVDNRWTPLDLFGVCFEKSKWHGLLFNFPTNAHITAIDDMFIRYSLSSGTDTYNFIKSYNLNSKLFWNL